MANSGGGQGSPIETLPIIQVPYDQSEELDATPNCAVSIPRYAKIVGYDEPSFWGVVYENQSRFDCSELWTEASRMRLQNALAQAQQMLEQFIGFPLCPTWIVGTVQEEPNLDNRWVDQQSYKFRVLTRYPRLIAAGVRAEETVASSVALTHDDKFGSVTLTIDFDDPDEVFVFYPGSRRRVYPSSVVIVGDQLTIKIPRYRLVRQDYLDTPQGGIMYEDMDAYLASVDVVRVYNDPSVNAVLVRPGCHNNLCSGGCTECTHAACMYIRDSNIGYVDLKPALWDADGGAWNSKIICGTGYTIARLHYLCGMQKLNLQAENAIVHLAHTLLHTPPCSCDWLKSMWEKDREYPALLTREILNNPFGKGNGAWTAYTWAKSIASVRMSVL